MSIFIEGTIFPLGSINKNDWGIPHAEEQNAIQTAKTAVVRVCSRIEPHICDFQGDPLSEIGRAADVWRSGNDIVARAEIIDSVAAQKISDGVWEPNWSVFATYGSIDAEGWLHDVRVESITLVNSPAWEQAKWKVVSAADGNRKLMMQTFQYKFASAYDEKNQNKTEKTEGDIIPKTIDELEAENAELKKEIDKIKGVVSEDVAPGDTGDDENTETPPDDGGNPVEGDEPPAEESPGDGDLKAQVASLKTQIRKLTAASASHVPPEAVQNLIKVAIANHDKEQAKKVERETAFASFVEARAELGMETDQEEFGMFGASQLNKFTDDLVRMKKVASESGSGLKFVAQSSAPARTVGRWDSTKKEWV